MRRAEAPAAVLLAAALLSGPAAAGQRPCAEPGPDAPLPRIALETVAKGLESPVALEHAGDGLGRVFIVEQEGRIRVLARGVVSTTPFLDIESRVRSGGEMGLLGLAFHPRFPRDPRLFVNYTSSSGGLHSVIAEYRLGASRDAADPASERIVLTYAQPWENHNGGDLAFGPDGMLYVGTGDGGAGNDPKNSGQSPDSLLGKMLRIDVNGTDGGRAYRIPSNNPFRKKAGWRPEIWARGLRNPWRYNFDRTTGLLWAGDVGQNHWEEVDVVRRGRNYGWRVMEGTHCTPGIGKDCDPKGFELPVVDYPREEGGCVTGGHVYRGSAIPGLCGMYVYGDYNNGRIWGLRFDGAKARARGLLLDTGRPLSAFGEDESGELYALDHTGEILKIVTAR